MAHTDVPLHAQTSEDILESFGVDPDTGLSPEQRAAHKREHGQNVLRRTSRRKAWSILLDQAKSMVLILMAAAGVLAFAFGQWPEGIAVTAVFVVNGFIGFFSEWRATRSMEALRKLGGQTARVRSEGSERSVPVRTLVRGDIVVLEGGDAVPADLRLIEANGMRVDESPLTGESVSVNKFDSELDRETTLAECSNMVFKGTTVVEGSGAGVVVATGMQTELGRIADLAETAEKTATPLQKRLDLLGRRLAWVTIIIAVVVAALGLLSGQPTILMIETAVALGVAAIPEGLPIVATIALARGMWVMARRNALVNRLPAVETLGATGAIFTDKTGTLTENRMTARQFVTPIDGYDFESEEPIEAERDETLRRALEVAVLCNNAAIPDGDVESAQGDPTEIALLEAGRDLGIDRDSLLREWPEVREVAFDSEKMMMATFHEASDGLRVAVKGAPRAVLGVCGSIADENGSTREFPTEEKDRWLDQAESLAADGLRLLAVAERRVDDSEVDPYQDLRFLALVALLDPARPQAREAIAECKKAGVRVIMVTGDQPATAAAIGRDVGIVEESDAAVLTGADLDEPERLSAERRDRIIGTDIFARVSPEQKLHLIRTYQDHGLIVAMTGDGVNDAPALKKADIGVAMGKRGTDAARQAADMVLRDDALSSIVAAIAQGRVIFGNIRKSVIFMLCTNVSEVLAVAISAAALIPIPLLPLQILYLNVLTDVFPALALGVGPGDPRGMTKPPRPPREPVLTRHHWSVIVAWAVFMAACVLGAMGIAILFLEFDRTSAVTASFLTLGFAKLWFVFNLRDPGSTLLDNDVVRNPWIWMSLAFCAALLIAAVYMPGLTALLRTGALGAKGWGLVLSLSLVPFLAGQVIRALQHARRESP